MRSFFLGHFIFQSAVFTWVLHLASQHGLSLAFAISIVVTTGCLVLSIIWITKAAELDHLARYLQELDA